MHHLSHLLTCVPILGEILIAPLVLSLTYGVAQSGKSLALPHSLGKNRCKSMIVAQFRKRGCFVALCGALHHLACTLGFGIALPLRPSRAFVHLISLIYLDRFNDLLPPLFSTMFAHHHSCEFKLAPSCGSSLTVFGFGLNC